MVTRSPSAALPFLVLEGAGALGDLLDLLVDFVFGDFDDFTNDGKAVGRLQFDLRDDFVGEREFEIGLGIEDLFRFLLVLGHGDRRLGRRLLAAIG
jgi:hypothetical protein